ncbi:MAG: hypothetical protein AAGA48_26685 [Myxococcota bacterium]
MAPPDETSHGPLPTSMVRASAFDEAGWAVRTLAGNASTVGRWPIARAMAGIVMLLILLPLFEFAQTVLGQILPLVLFALLLALGVAFVAQVSAGAEPIFRRLRLDRRRLVIDEIRGDWTLDESEVLSAEGAQMRHLDYDDITEVAYADERITIGRREADPWVVDWLPPAMSEEVVTHLRRTLSDRDDVSTAAARKAALQRLVAERPAE